MTDLAAWLLQQIAEDEAAAREASIGSSVWPHSQFETAGPVVLHARRHDPARVLAECAAKRAIVESYVRWQAGHPGDCKGEEGYVLESGSDFDLFGPCKQHEALSTVAARRHTLLLLAQPYADRPGFDPAWRLEQHTG